MKTTQEKKICFVISPIGEEGSETRERADQVLKHIISASIEPLGYEVIRADKISEPGIITTQIIENIVDAELVIADLTEKNPNVFYELALRHAIRKPLVQMIKKGEIIPFDVAATRIIQFDLQSLDSVASAKEEIISQVKTLETGKNEVHNPISVSLDLKVLKESGSKEERSLADIVEGIADLRLAFASVDKGSISQKAMDELKMLITTLSNRMENQFDSDFRKRRRRIHPMMIEDMMMMDKNPEGSKYGFLMMLSFFKDDFPWIYEIGMETYRDLKSAKTKTEKRRLLENFDKIFEMIGHPMMREFYGKSEDSCMYSKDLQHFIRRYLDRYIEDNNFKELM
jgi:hypothetical protein